MTCLFQLRHWARGFAIAALLLALGCATRRVDWESRLGLYSYDQAVLELGPPEKEATLTDGARVAEWLTRRSGAGGAIAYGGGYGHAGYYHPYHYRGPSYYSMHGVPTREYWLRLTFDPDGKLSAWRKLTK